MNLATIIRNLQNQPYQKRIRLLWIAVAATAAVILVLWIVTLKFRQLGDSGNTQPFYELWNEIKQITKITKFKNQ